MSKRKIELNIPERWRTGQYIFNFLWWLQEKKGVSPEIGTAGRMADPFHIQDKAFNDLLDEYDETL